MSEDKNEHGLKINGRVRPKMIQEGKVRKGGVNSAPKTPRPNVRPQPQKPQNATAQGSSGGSNESE